MAETQLARDPFARTTLFKSRIAPVDVSFNRCTCDWCGGTDARGALWRFHTKTDGGRRIEHKGRFCASSCFRSYNG